MYVGFPHGVYCAASKPASRRRDAVAMCERIVSVTAAASRASRAWKISRCSCEGGGRVAFVGQRAVHPDAQQRADALEQLLRGPGCPSWPQFRGGRRRPPPRRPPGHQGCPPWCARLARMRSSASSLIRCAASWAACTSRPLAELHEFPGPGGAQHQPPAERAGQQLGDAVAKVGSGAGPDNHDAQDLQGGQGLAHRGAARLPGTRPAGARPAGGFRRAMSPLVKYASRRSATSETTEPCSMEPRAALILAVDGGGVCGHTPKRSNRTRRLRARMRRSKRNTSTG